ncbi:ABC transporter permease [Paenibacillus eucommiae]|uniref:ABC-2 type transport system permease protein n=1 Tax=Paenibacillus eucommiae TaxID=1355755 RepID=A0ABS4J9Q4_9BACL|nr:ABC-2 family transporter protein [Paenibacillus eucommiae]MBP1996572.1 ABC-2 type transport system permease protein [Paenibacillus eucommiae]
MKTLQLFYQYQRLHYAKWGQYTSNFVIEALTSLLELTIGLLTLSIVFSKINLLGGWSLPEMLLLYATWILGLSFYHTFGQNIAELSNYIRTGAFDLILMKPVHPLFHMVCLGLNTKELSRMAYGIVILIVAVNIGNFPVEPYTWFIYILMVLFCNLLNFALYATAVSVCFWLGYLPSLYGILFSFTNVMQYPLDIYPSLIRLVFIVLPLSFTSYFPAMYLLDKHGGSMGFLTPVIAIIWTLLAVKLWNKGIRYYQSTGN